jgi:hypothetical protein
MAINQDINAIVPKPKQHSGFFLIPMEVLRDNLFEKVLEVEPRNVILGGQ